MLFKMNLLGKLTTFWLVLILVPFAALWAQTVVWSEDFETNADSRWYAENGVWEIGTPTVGPSKAFSGTKCMATVLGGNYPRNCSTRMIRITSFTVPSKDRNPNLRFWHCYSFNDKDYAVVQLKIVGTDSWVNISPQYTNTGSGAWTCPRIDLSEYANMHIQIAFFFYAAGYYESSGWYIDDISLQTGLFSFGGYESWEEGIGDWSADNGTWEIGRPSSGPGKAFTGTNCAATALNGNYARHVESRLTSPKFLVPESSSNPRLRIWHWYSFNDHDYGTVQLKKDGTDEWINVSPIYNNTSSSAWTCPLIDLSVYSNQHIQIAFYFYATGYYESSGWYIDDIKLITGKWTTNEIETWEDGIGDWSSERGTWEVGKPTSGPNKSFGGEKCAATVLGGNYGRHVDSWLLSPPITVRATNPNLRFRHWYSFNDHDFGEVQIKVVLSEDWETLPAKYSGTGGSWTYPFFDLSSYKGKQIQIAFRFYATGYYESSGWYIDDVELPIATTSYKLTISPTAITFPATKADASRDTLITISSNYPNATTASIIFGGSSGPFSVDATQVTIPSNGSKTIKVSFSPQQIGNYSAMLNIRDNAANAATAVQLTGSATKPDELPTLKPVSSQTTLYAGEEFWIDVQAGSAAAQVNGLFGIAFKLSYESANVEVVEMKAGPFLGADIVPIFNNSPTEGAVSIGLSRKAGTGGVNSFGVVASVRFKAKQSISTDTMIQFCTSDIDANNSLGAPIQFISACAYVTLKSCIQAWPGDTNNDGAVNEKDVLPLGLYWHRTGPTNLCRQQNSFKWQSCCVTPWAPLNATYADNNGDGKIDEKDILQIGFHFGKTYTRPSINVDEKRSTMHSAKNSARMVLQTAHIQNAGFMPGDSCRIDIWVEDVSQLFGLSYKVAFRNQERVKILDAEMGDFLGSDILFFPNIDDETGIVSIGETRKDSPNTSSGTGVVGRIYFQLTPNNTVGDLIFVEVFDISANDAEGNEIAISGTSQNMVVKASAKSEALPTHYALHQNYPNPFNPQTTITFETPRDGHVQLVVMNSLGQIIQSLVDGTIGAGNHTTVWNGVDQSGQPVSSGIYFYRLKSDHFEQTRKMLLVR